ncbi:ESS2-like protein [Mya arenaria]|uniref:ESS2-like protein n=1 Tax=Mya arenaria TaxID=6604 RepID=A0ABY7DIA9_MYAAR|nr:ESS2-like protein [Mya arenaria]
MDLAKVCSKALVVAKPKGALGPEKKKVNVLDEETYAEAEYMEAVEKNDLVKLRELELRFSKRPNTDRSIYNTPSTFDTPERGEHPSTQKSTQGVNLPENNLESVISETKGSKQHLDSFLSKNTKNDRLALPNIEDQAAITDGQAGVDTWKYKIKNALMYIPDGEDYSAAELVELKKKIPRKIVHENTRFQDNPWNSVRNKEAMKQAASDKALLFSGKIGHDGKEVEVGITPRVNGYGFVATPSPAPGVEDSPFMTWGEIEGTPFQLTNETPLMPSDAPAFKIPAVPHRDKLALELAEKASKQHRDKKENALKLASRLARTGTDKALRASYSPSPSRTPGDKTPKLTPKLTPKNKTPVYSSSPRSTPGSKRDASEVPSLTDNLLHIPKKRSKATDFF